MGFDIGKISYATGSISNLLQFTKTILDRSSGDSIGTRLQNAGIDYIGNNMALGNAKDIYTHTGSSLGYAGLFAAKGDGATALNNTTNASLWAATYLTPNYYNNMFGMGNGMYGARYTNYSSYSYGNNSGFNVFNTNPFFRNGSYWG